MAQRNKDEHKSQISDSLHNNQNNEKKGGERQVDTVKPKSTPPPKHVLMLNHCLLPNPFQGAKGQPEKKHVCRGKRQELELEMEE